MRLRRRKAPSSPRSLQRSASASSKRFSLEENWRRLVLATTSGSAAAAQGIPSLALRAPSGMPWAEVEESLITEDFITAAMSEYYLWSLNCRRQMFRVTLAQGVGLLYSESYYDKAHAMPYVLECAIDKNRNGERGECLWRFTGQYSRVEPLDSGATSEYRRLRAKQQQRGGIDL